MSFRSRLDDLPLFASDLEIAEAVVGKRYAKEWAQTRLPTLAGKTGFPPIDPFHEGRPVPLVRRFYESYLGLGGVGAPQGAADPAAWKSAIRGKRKT
ncbi:conserved hypothetical protein [Mesorhizobium prunaredense]|uniref:Uncharacterized protein n=1 Tax=Mesorhizobium prunaredense TaxID=1631249 RepID=A0A1R3UYD7_9HYPH|nr:conserved hypothetical protein [Mesorhizobium prunaredense]